ncbi:hypothetical protein ACLFMI_16210 [Pseudonocardia nantongensis]|uniref:hypothetical protein n=1 Tax=Pseudonocardia nantongensis TaxID=1181885 RepID=UPI0039787887
MAGSGTTGAGGVVRADPDRLDTVAAGLAEVAAALADAAAQGPRPEGAAGHGFVTPAIAAELAVRWAAALDVDTAAARHGSAALRAAAAGWRAADEAAAAGFAPHRAG